MDTVRGKRIGEKNMDISTGTGNRSTVDIVLAAWWKVLMQFKKGRLLQSIHE
jgi:hypothetical protein